jgi:hypothetical protein
LRSKHFLTDRRQGRIELGDAGFHPEADAIGFAVPMGATHRICGAGFHILATEPHRPRCSTSFTWATADDQSANYVVARVFTSCQLPDGS